jgi:hypothetical protein
MRKVSGNEYHYENFLSDHEKIPALQTIVTDFNEKGVTLSKEPSVPTEEEPSGANLDTAAKTAAKKALKQP